MRDRLADLGSHTKIALITFTDPARLDDYRRANDLPFPILVDPDRAAYRAFGLGRGTVARVWGLRMLARYWEIARTDGLGGLRRPTEDTLQLGGDFVIDAEGRLAYGFWGEGPDDRPSVDELIGAVDKAHKPG